LQEHGIAETLDALLEAGWKSLKEVAYMTEDDMKAAGMKGFSLKMLKELKESLPSAPVAAAAQSSSAIEPASILPSKVASLQPGEAARVMDMAQETGKFRSPIKIPEKSQKLEALKGILEEHDIGHLLEDLVKNGFNSVQDLAEMSEEEMTAIGIKIGFIKKLKKLQASLAAQADKAAATAAAAKQAQEDADKAAAAAAAAKKAQEDEQAQVAASAAAAAAQAQLAQLLASAGVKHLEEVDEDGKTALIRAADKGEEAHVKQLIVANANLNAKDDGGWTALIWAAYRGHTPGAQALIEAKADLNAKNNNRSTALILAACNGNTPGAQALIEAKADLNAKDNVSRGSLVDISSCSGLLWGQQANLSSVLLFLRFF
jgi:hypothetical protein